MTDRNMPPVSRRRVLGLTAVLALGAVAGCENADVGSMPKMRKSKGEFLEELDKKSTKKKKGQRPG